MTTRKPHRLVLALGGLLFTSLAAPALAQSVGIGADGSVHVDGGDGTVVNTDASGTRVRTRGATVESHDHQDISSRSGDHRSGGDNLQRTHGDRSRVGVEIDGGVHVNAAGGGRATTTVRNRTITSPAPASRGGMATYVNQELNESNFSGLRLEGVAFVNSELKRADFHDAILIGANFANAELVDADFRGANLRNAQFTNAELSGARFDGATWIDGRICGEESTGGCR